MKRPAQHRISLPSSVRARLTFWYLAMMAFIVCLFGGSLYVTQTHLNADAAESRLETQLYQDSRRVAQSCGQTQLDRLAPTALRRHLAAQAEVLLLRPNARGPAVRSALAGRLHEPLPGRH